MNNLLYRSRQCLDDENAEKAKQDTIEHDTYVPPSEYHMIYILIVLILVVLTLWNPILNVLPIFAFWVTFPAHFVANKRGVSSNRVYSFISSTINRFIVIYPALLPISSSQRTTHVVQGGTNDRLRWTGVGHSLLSQGWTGNRIPNFTTAGRSSCTSIFVPLRRNASRTSSCPSLKNR